MVLRLYLCFVFSLCERKNETQEEGKVPLRTINYRHRVSPVNFKPLTLNPLRFAFRQRWWCAAIVAHLDPALLDRVDHRHRSVVDLQLRKNRSDMILDRLAADR